MALVALFELVRNKRVVPLGKCIQVVESSLAIAVGDSSAAEDDPAGIPHYVVGEAVMVGKIARLVAVAGDCIETFEGVLKCQKLKNLYHLQVEVYFACTCIDIAYLVILLLEISLAIVFAIIVAWQCRK